MSILVISTLRNGERTREFFTYDTYDDAIAAFYHSLWVAVSKSNLVNVICEIIGDDGNVNKRETFTRIFPEEPAEVEPFNKEG